MWYCNNSRYLALQRLTVLYLFSPYICKHMKRLNLNHFVDLFRACQIGTGSSIQFMGCGAHL